MNGLEIIFNGQPLRTQASHLQALVQERGYPPDGAFACAVNNQFVPRAAWSAQSLKAQDRIDLIAPITGG